jgi:hypothetical protein
MAVSIESTATYSLDSQSASHAVTLPTGVSAGDLLLMFFLKHQSGDTITTPTGWTLLQSFVAGGNKDAAIFAKIATGSEGSTATVTISNAQRAVAVTLLVNGHAGGLTSADIAVSTENEQSNTLAPDPPSLTPSWGSAENLWVAAGFCNSGTFTFGSYPSGYALGINTIQVSGTNGGGISVACKLATGTSEDPGGFTISSSSRDWSTFTLAIRPLVAKIITAETPGGYAFTGAAASLLHAIILTGAAGAYALTGTPASLIKQGSGAKVIGAETGAYTLTGAAAGLLYGREVVAAAGSYALTGATANLARLKGVSADAGFYTITGASASLIYSGGLEARTWPELVGAPQTWTRAAADTVAEFKPSIGTPRVRRMVTTAQYNCSGSFRLTSTQKDALIAFWFDTCDQGAMTFRMIDPEDGLTARVWEWAEAPDPQHYSADVWDVAVSLIRQS